MLTRRDLGGFLGAALGLAFTSIKLRAAAPSKLRIDILREQCGLSPGPPTIRAYRADALVTLLGVPVFARKDVGGAFAAVREASERERKIVALQFAGGSDPERTHGLVYDGSHEEVVLECASVRTQAGYFGFVTSTSDESYEQARERILAQSKRPDSYVAVEGWHSTGFARCEKSLISLADRRSCGLTELIQRIRGRFCDTQRTEAELPTPGQSAAYTFLHSVLTAIRSGQPRSEFHYVHNARTYRMDLERSPDRRAGVALAARRRTTHPDTVTRLTGRTSLVGTRQGSTFRMWLDDQSDFPLRIEFQPRSYLRIVLESQPAAAQPNIQRTEEP